MQTPNTTALSSSPALMNFSWQATDVIFWRGSDVITRHLRCTLWSPDYKTPLAISAIWWYAIMMTPLIASSMVMRRVCWCFMQTSPNLYYGSGPPAYQVHWMVQTESNCNGLQCVWQCLAQMHCTCSKCFQQSVQVWSSKRVIHRERKTPSEIDLAPRKSQSWLNRLYHLKVESKILI